MRPAMASQEQWREGLRRNGGAKQLPTASVVEVLGDRVAPPLHLSYARSAADGVPDIDLILAKMPHSQKKCEGLPDPSVLTICVEI
jgi:hypothetical protein